MLQWLCRYGSCEDALGKPWITPFPCPAQKKPSKPWISWKPINYKEPNSRNIRTNGVPNLWSEKPRCRLRICKNVYGISWQCLWQYGQFYLRLPKPHHSCVFLIPNSNMITIKIIFHQWCWLSGLVTEFTEGSFFFSFFYLFLKI